MSFDALLSEDDPPVFLVERAKGSSVFLLTCDHAGREIPHRLASLSLSEHELSTHVAWDLGVAELGRRLSARLDAFLIVHNYSRLVIDANRPPGAPDSIPTLCERIRIAANEGVSSSDARKRLDEVFQPYHQRIRDELDARSARACRSVLVALHSFTPVYMGEGARAYAKCFGSCPSWNGRKARHHHHEYDIASRATAVRWMVDWPRDSAINCRGHDSARDPRIARLKHCSGLAQAQYRGDPGMARAIYRAAIANKLLAIAARAT